MPILKTITIPTLVGMLVAGCLARNFLPGILMDPYPASFAAYLRSICLSTLLIRGGLSITFKGNGLIVALITIIP